MRLKDGNYLNDLLIELEKNNVSDVHLKAGCKIYYRCFGDIKLLADSKIVDNQLISLFLNNVMNDKIKHEFEDKKQVDFAFSTSNETRYRANLYKTSTGNSLSLRRINNKIFSFDELLLPDILKKIANLEKGLVIISGATGSGKSTTLTSIIDYINNNQEKHIITIEDPIEFVHKNNKCLINQREIGDDAKSFALSIKSSLREDPDIILIGEIRDSESIKECLKAAETGHLVFTTLHTQSSSKTIDRIIDSCEAEEKNLIRSMLATSLQAVILQKLLKKKDGTGMVAAYEILLCTNAVKNLIKENRIMQIDSMIQTGKKFGMIDMNTSIENLFKNEIISKEEFDCNTLTINKEQDEQRFN